MASPFTPLLDPGKERYDNPSFMNTPAQIEAAQRSSTPKANAVIPQELSSIEDNLKAEGSSTSTLGHIMAWLGAAKGDFRGLQSIEESKRRTALAKSIVPEVNKVNTLTNAGKWEEASDYVNKLVGSYGARADYLVPYFTQMQANISKKQEGWQNLVGLAEMMKAGGASDPENPNYRAYQALSKAVADKTPISETNLQGFMTRYGKPETQVIDGRVTRISPLGGPTQTEYLPAISKASDFANFAGNTVASGNNLNTKQLADLHNGLTVTNDKGEKIEPNSKAAQTIKTQFNALQPINARLEMAALAQIPPEVAVRLLEEQGLLKVAIRDFGRGNVVQSAYDTIREEDTKKQIAINTGTMASDPRALPQGKLPFDLDTFEEVKTAVTPKQIDDSKGRLILLRPEVINNQIKPALAEIESLSQIPQLLTEANATPQTTGDKLSLGLRQYASSWLGYPIGNDVEVRQAVKVRLRRAIEFMEGTSETSPGIVGKDDPDLRDLKAYAAGDFKSHAELTKAVERVTQRLQQILRRAVGGMESEEVSTTTNSKSPARTPAEILAPVINKARKGKQRQSQITNESIYEQGKIQIPEGLDPELTRRVLETGKAAQQSGKVTGGAMRVEIPIAGQPAQQYNEDDEVKKAMQQKRLQRVR